jgi:hypothetical protein
VVKVERHELGPRVYVLGLRIHEVAVGLALIVLLLAFGGTDHWELTKRFDAAAAFGAWLVIKDWRDLFPSKRNTAAWGVLPHRVRRR